MHMKKILLFTILLLCITNTYGQKTIKYTIHNCTYVKKSYPEKDRLFYFLKNNLSWTEIDLGYYIFSELSEEYEIIDSLRIKNVEIKNNILKIEYYNNREIYTIPKEIYLKKDGAPDWTLTNHEEERPRE